jgi:hypothetical protein
VCGGGGVCVGARRVGVCGVVNAGLSTANLHVKTQQAQHKISQYSASKHMTRATPTPTPRAAPSWPPSPRCWRRRTGWRRRGRRWPPRRSASRPRRPPARSSRSGLHHISLYVEATSWLSPVLESSRTITPASNRALPGSGHTQNPTPTAPTDRLTDPNHRNQPTDHPRLQNELELQRHSLQLLQDRIAGSESSQLAEALAATEAEAEAARGAKEGAAVKRKEMAEMAKVGRLVS